MKKVYPVVKDKYRFLGGWKDIPSQLTDLIVGHGYDITPSGKNDYIIRGASKLIMVGKRDFEYYFEPFIDYFAEPEIIPEEGELEDARDEARRPTIHELEINSLRIASSDTQQEQLSLF